MTELHREQISRLCGCNWHRVAFLQLNGDIEEVSVDYKCCSMYPLCWDSDPDFAQLNEILKQRDVEGWQ